MSKLSREKSRRHKRGRVKLQLREEALRIERNFYANRKALSFPYRYGA